MAYQDMLDRNEYIMTALEERDMTKMLHIARTMEIELISMDGESYTPDELRLLLIASIFDKISGRFLPVCSGHSKLFHLESNALYTFSGNTVYKFDLDRVLLMDADIYFCSELNILDLFIMTEGCQEDEDVGGCEFFIDIVGGLAFSYNSGKIYVGERCSKSDVDTIRRKILLD